MKHYYKYLLIACITLTAGCGFHLRHMYANLSKQYPVMVLPASGSITFYQAVYRGLQAQSIKVLQQVHQTETYPILTITNELLTQFPLVYGPDSELRRERLTLTVTFSFQPPPPDQAISFTLIAQRDRQLNNKQHLGDNDEKILIEQEMQADIIGQLFRYIDSLSRYS